MSRKAFHIGIDLDVHAVSCPGVWLCPKGDVMLRISMLGASAHTKRVEPVFPLLFHESFHFRKTLVGVTSLTGLQSVMTKRAVLIQLVQWQVHGCRCVLLASFRSSLSELLYPQPAAKRLLAGVDIDLLMEPTTCFPGIIAPKIEISTRVVVEEMINYPIHSQDSNVVNRKTLASKGSENKIENKSEGKNKNLTRPRMRQKSVCHTRPNVRCYYCKQRVDRVRKVQGRGDADRKCVSSNIPANGDDTLYIPYCNKCGDVVEETEAKQGKIIIKEGAQDNEKWDTACSCAEPLHSSSACACNLCRRYENLFKNSVSPRIDSFSTKSPQWKDRLLSPTKGKHCPCLDAKVGASDRLRAGAVHRVDHHCGAPPSSSSDPSDYLGDTLSDLLQKDPLRHEDYQKMLEADLDAHYKKLFERVSRRSNRHKS